MKVGDQVRSLRLSNSLGFSAFDSPHSERGGSKAGGIGWESNTTVSLFSDADPEKIKPAQKLIFGGQGSSTLLRCGNSQNLAEGEVGGIHAIRRKPAIPVACDGEDLSARPGSNQFSFSAELRLIKHLAITLAALKPSRWCPPPRYQLRAPRERNTRYLRRCCECDAHVLRAAF
jgi:hypothetical protein